MKVECGIGSKKRGEKNRWLTGRKMMKVGIGVQRGRATGRGA